MNNNILIEAGIKHLSEVMPVLPPNCLFDKGRVGCGGTSIAIEGDDAYVIAVPYTALIKDKVAQYNGELPHERYHGQICGVMAGVDEDCVIEYLEETRNMGWVPKFIVTYESLGRLTSYINPKDYKLLVDELHILFNAYRYREVGVNNVLDKYKEYSEFCFMSASVMEKEFMLDELLDIPIISAKWEEKKEINMYSVHCKNNVKYTVAFLVDLYLKQNQEGNAYFFVNSVEFIRNMVAFCGLDESNTRVVYSDNNKMDVGIKRGKPSDETKKINFITSTAFEGVDFMDENGRIYIVSDNSKPNTMLDVSTSVVQIAGRIRNTKYWDKIFHIYTPTPYMTTSYDDFKLKTEQNIEMAKRIVDIHNNVVTDEYRRAVDVYSNNYYVTPTDNNMLKFDGNLSKLDLYHFKTTSYLYSSNNKLQKEYKKYGFNVIRRINEAPEMEPIADAKSVGSMNFKDTINQLKEYSKQGVESFLYNIAISDASQKFPNIRGYLELFGFDGIEKRKYHKGNIETEYIAQSDTDVRNKIYSLLVTKFELKRSKIVHCRKAKTTMQDIYDLLGIKKKAKGSDLQYYFDIKESSRKIKVKKNDGTIVSESVRVYEIGPHKPIFERL